jgi:hypothetical protein
MLDYQWNNFIAFEKVNRDRREEIMEDAHRSQLLSKAGIRQFTLVDRILVHVGGMLIRLGIKLQERCLFTLPQGSRPRPSKY